MDDQKDREVPINLGTEPIYPDKLIFLLNQYIDHMKKNPLNGIYDFLRIEDLARFLETEMKDQK